MYSYIFSATDSEIETAIASLATIDELCEQFFDVVLSNENEFEILMSFLGIPTITGISIENNQDFCRLYDLSSSYFPILDEKTFDEFYDLWLTKTGRETAMDEYGQLLFIREIANLWNKRAHRFVVLEKRDQLNTEI